jgi:hypothetical protein
MGERVFTRNLPLAPAKAEGHAGAGGRERLKTHAGQDARRADIPGIGDDERPLAMMEGAQE